MLTVVVVLSKALAKVAILIEFFCKKIFIYPTRFGVKFTNIFASKNLFKKIDPI
jgi:hypothetical protein